jgi:hypothetical protein
MVHFLNDDQIVDELNQCFSIGCLSESDQRDGKTEAHTGQAERALSWFRSFGSALGASPESRPLSVTSASEDVGLNSVDVGKSGTRVSSSRQRRRGRSSQKPGTSLDRLLLRILQRLSGKLARLADEDVRLYCDACERLIWYGGVLVLRALATRTADGQLLWDALEVSRWYVRFLATNIAILFRDGPQHSVSSILEPGAADQFQRSVVSGNHRRIGQYTCDSLEPAWRYPVGLLLAHDALILWEGQAIRDSASPISEVVEDILEHPEPGLLEQQWLEIGRWTTQHLNGLLKSSTAIDGADNQRFVHEEESEQLWRMMLALTLRVFLVVHAFGPPGIQALQSNTADSALYSVPERLAGWLVEDSIPALERIHSRVRALVAISEPSLSKSFRACFESTRDVLLSCLERWRGFWSECCQHSSSRSLSIAWAQVRLYTLRLDTMQPAEWINLVKMVCREAKLDQHQETQNFLYTRLLRMLLTMADALSASLVLEDESLLHWLVECWANIDAAHACEQLMDRVQDCDAVAMKTGDTPCSDDVIQARQVLSLASLLCAADEMSRAHQWLSQPANPTDWRNSTSYPALQVLIRHAHRHDTVRDWLVHTALQLARDDHAELDPRFARQCLVLLQRQLQTQVSSLISNVTPASPISRTSHGEDEAAAIAHTAERVLTLTHSLCSRQPADAAFSVKESERLRQWAAAVLHNAAADLYERGRFVATAMEPRDPPDPKTSTSQQLFVAAAQCWQYSLKLCVLLQDVADCCTPPGTLSVHWLRTGMGRLAYGMQAWVHAVQPKAARSLWCRWSEILWTPSGPSSDTKMTPSAAAPPWELCTALFQCLQAACSTSVTAEKLQAFLQPLSNGALCLLGVAMDRLWRHKLRTAYIQGADPSKSLLKGRPIYLMLHTVLRLLLERSTESTTTDEEPPSSAISVPTNRDNELQLQSLRSVFQNAIRLLEWLEPMATGERSITMPTGCANSKPFRDQLPIQGTNTDATATIHDVLQQLLYFLATHALCSASTDPASEAKVAIAASTSVTSVSDSPVVESERPSVLVARLVRLAAEYRCPSPTTFQQTSPAGCWLAWWQREQIWDALELAARLFQQMDLVLPALHCVDAMRRLARHDPWRQSLCTARAMLLCQQLEWKDRAALYRSRFERMAASSHPATPIGSNADPSRWQNWCQQVLQLSASNDSPNRADPERQIPAQSDAQYQGAGVAIWLWKYALEMNAAKHLASIGALVTAIEAANRALSAALQAQQLLMPLDPARLSVPILGPTTLAAARSGATLVFDAVMATQCRPVEMSAIVVADGFLEAPTRAICRALDLLATLSTYLGAWKDALYYLERAVALCGGSNGMLLAAARSHSLMHLSLLLTRAGQLQVAEQHRREAVALCRLWDDEMGFARSLWTLPLAYRQTQLGLFRIASHRRSSAAHSTDATNRKIVATVLSALERTWRLADQEARLRCSEQDALPEIVWHVALRLVWSRALLFSMTQDPPVEASMSTGASLAASLEEIAHRLQPLLASTQVPFPASLEALSLYLILRSIQTSANVGSEITGSPFDFCLQRWASDFLSSTQSIAWSSTAPFSSGRQGAERADPAHAPFAQRQVSPILLGGSPWLLAPSVCAEHALAILAATRWYRSPRSVDLLLHGAVALLRTFGSHWRRRCTLMRRRPPSVDAAAAAAATACQPPLWDNLNASDYLERLSYFLPARWMILALRYDPLSRQSARIAIWSSGEHRATKIAVDALAEQLETVQIREMPTKEAKTSPSWYPCSDHPDCRSWCDPRGMVRHLQAQFLHHHETRPHAQQLECELQQLLDAAAETHITTEAEAQSMSAAARRAWWQTRAQLDVRFGHWLEQRLGTLLENLSVFMPAVSASVLERDATPAALPSGAGNASIDTVLLLTDTNHDRLPLEAVPVLAGCSVIRFPASAALEDALAQQDCALGAMSHSARMPSMPKRTTPKWQRGAFLINPTGDLARTERFLRPLLTDDAAFALPHGWYDLSQESGDLYARLAREQPSVLLYCGHGAGEAYLQPRRLARQMETVPHTIFLMGCRSGHLEHAEALDAHGAVLDWLAAGAECVVAQLWDVTDGDLDRLTVATWQQLSERFLLGQAPCCDRHAVVAGAAATGPRGQAQLRTDLADPPQASGSACPTAETVRSQPTALSAVIEPEADLPEHAGPTRVATRSSSSVGTLQAQQLSLQVRSCTSASLDGGPRSANPSSCAALGPAAGPSCCHSSLPVAQAVRVARSACRLRWVNGAASVVYGSSRAFSL